MNGLSLRLLVGSALVFASIVSQAFLAPAIVGSHPPCPRVRISGPSSKREDRPVIYRSTVHGMENPAFDWSVNAGRISNRQDAGRGSRINVNAMGIAPGTLTATVKVTNFPAGCQNSASKQTQITPAPSLPNMPPTISSFSASLPNLILPCPPGTRPKGCKPSRSMQVRLTTTATDPDGDTLNYTYGVTAGRITGGGANITWDLSGVQPGTYSITVEVTDGRGLPAFASETVTVTSCTCEPRSFMQTSLINSRR